MWLGFLRAGTLGAPATSAAFIAPSFVFVFAVAVVYAHYQGLRVVQALFFGVAPAVMAIIAIAAYRLAKLTNSRDRRLWTISVILAVVTATTGSEIALLVIAAGLLMILLDARPRWLHRRPQARAVPALLPLSAKTLVGKTLTAKTLAVATATGETLAALGWFFVKAGALIFGSGLAIVPFLRQGVVYQHHWLTNIQFLDAVAIGLITPGPVVITATFIGYLTAGWQGAIVATVAIFTPIYLSVVLVGHWLIRHRDNPQIKAFVTGATAAAAGAITGAVVVLSRQTIHRWTGAAIAVIALAVLLKWKVKEPFVVVAGAVAGLALHWLW